MIVLLLSLILASLLLSNGVVIYLLFKLLPKEKQREILRKIEPLNKTEIKEWQPPIPDEEKLFNDVLESLKK